MNRVLRIATVMTMLAAPVGANAQRDELTVVAMSHHTQESDYTTSTPVTSNTGCTANYSNVNCTTTSYGGETQTHAVYRLNEVVISNGIRYTLARTARWRWSSLDWLQDGESFPAEIKGKHMYITCRRGGNQGKKETIKYDIMDIRPNSPRSVAAASVARSASVASLSGTAWTNMETYSWQNYNSLSTEDKAYVQAYCPANSTGTAMVPQAKVKAGQGPEHAIDCSAWLSAKQKGGAI